MTAVAKLTTAPAVLKHCPKCATDKPLDAFSARRDRPDGKSCVCRECDRARLRARFERDQDAMRAAARERYHADPEKALAAVTAWKRANPDGVRRHRATAEAKRGPRKEYHKDLRQRNRMRQAAQSDPSFRCGDDPGFGLYQMPSGRYIALPFGRPAPLGGVLWARYLWHCGTWIERRAATKARQ